jgi:hypothetical protein
MRRIISGTKIATLLVLLLPFAAQAEEDANLRLLEESFSVHTSKKGLIINHPSKGTTEKKLPTVNAFKEAPGCYVACYSHMKQGSVYPVSSNIYVMGQVRVPGSYHDRICLPKGYEHRDISAEVTFKQLCEQ